MGLEIIDLSVPVDPNYWEPEPVKVKKVDHRQGADLLGKAFLYGSESGVFGRLRSWLAYLLGRRVTHRDFPDEKGLSLMTYTLTTHTGTHIDAPYHYGDVAADGSQARTISEVPLEWCFGDGVLLDVSVNPKEGTVSRGELKSKLYEIGYQIKPGDIVLIRTGGDAHIGGVDYFSKFRGVSRKATKWLVDQGVRVIGIDSFGFDAPFHKMISDYLNTGNKECLWPAHFFGREQEYCQIERMTNLDKIGCATGFKVSCFPIHLFGADASWCRAVAIKQKEEKK